MKKLATEILFQEDVDVIAERMTDRVKRKLELTREVSCEVFDIVWDELCELFPDLKYKCE